jgi:hypothetical protein
MGGFGLAMAAFLLVLRASGRKLPAQTSLVDLVFLSLATHKLSRIVARDKVTSPLRAPFTHYEQPDGPAEVEEKPRGRGFRKVVGEMISCPYCLDVWIATDLSCAGIVAPRVTRLVASIFAATAIADFLQRLYARFSTEGQSR